MKSDLLMSSNLVFCILLYHSCSCFADGFYSDGNEVDFQNAG